MTMSPEDGSLLAELKALRKRVDQLERADRLGMTSFREPGAIYFYDVNGVPRFWFGRRGDGQPGSVVFGYQDDDNQTQVLIGAQLSDGQLVQHGLTVFDPESSHGDRNILQVGRFLGGGDTFAIRYEDGQPAFFIDDGTALVVRDPAGTAQMWLTDLGMRRPHMPVHWAPGWQTDTAETSSFVEVAEGRTRRTFPNIWCQFRLIVSGTGTFEVRLVDDATSTVIDSVSGLTASTYGELEGTLPGSLMSWRVLKVEARRTDGSGSGQFAMVYGEVGGG